jgi:Lsr2
MAQKITVALEDDLDGGPADETVRSAISGTEYEIDLSKKNARALRQRLAPFIDHARKAGRGPRPRAGRTASSRERSSNIRAWAKTTGSRSATAGASPQASLISTKPDTKGTDTSWSLAGQNQPRPGGP